MRFMKKALEKERAMNEAHAGGIVGEGDEEQEGEVVEERERGVFKA